MERRDVADLMAFVAVAEHGSFTRAAAQLGRAQSGLSQSIAALEGRLGVPLLARTTRSVRPTEAGERLLRTLVPAFGRIEAGLADVTRRRDAVAGNLRLTVMEYPARRILMPALAELADRHPEVSVDVWVDDLLTDIVADGFDAGIRFGAHLERDMVAVPIGPPALRAVVVATPAYFARHGRPERLEDLAAHRCIDYRTAGHRDRFRWLFRQSGRNIEIGVDGRAAFDDAPVMIEAALAGIGLAYAFEAHVEEHLVAGRLETCLERYCPVWSGYHLYYPSRHGKSAALSALVEILKGLRDSCPVPRTR